MTEEQTQGVDRSLSGLGGWLIVVGFGVLNRPVRLCSDIWTLYNDIYVSGLLAEFSSPENENYDPAYMPIFVMEILINMLLIIFSIFLIYLFFSKKSLFPKLFIALLIVTPFIIAGDAAVIHYFYPVQPIFDAETGRVVLQTVFIAVIWVPYLLVSKRVKATFVNPMRRQNTAEVFS